MRKLTINLLTISAPILSNLTYINLLGGGSKMGFKGGLPATVEPPRQACFGLVGRVSVDRLQGSKVRFLAHWSAPVDRPTAGNGRPSVIWALVGWAAYLRHQKRLGWAN